MAQIHPFYKIGRDEFDRMVFLIDRRHYFWFLQFQLPWSCEESCGFVVVCSLEFQVEER